MRGPGHKSVLLLSNRSRIWPIAFRSGVDHSVGICFISDPCRLPMDEGSCLRYTLLWYYHGEANACRPFVFGGCGGNSNRFKSKLTCERWCKITTGRGTSLPFAYGGYKDKWVSTGQE
uniref:BPTI/Kunitz inhibitor domain-containing protein n=1 Tax=Chelydra serpentina TaxID=8475 RepID=A0A8C3T5N3_CHESE